MNRFKTTISAVLKQYASVVWRVMGSPRMPWLERAVASMLGVSVTVELPASRNARIAGIAVGGVITLSLVTWAGVAFTGGGDNQPEEQVEATATPTLAYLTELEALEEALVAARENGLTGEFAHIARRITLFEYAQATGEAYRAEQGLLQAPADTEVWAVSFAGDVRAELSTGDVVQYDNITIVVDALTGQVYRVEAFYGDFESPARAPVWLRPPATPTPTPSTDS